jgi:hypothetical protein
MRCSAPVNRAETQPNLWECRRKVSFRAASPRRTRRTAPATRRASGEEHLHPPHALPAALRRRRARRGAV